MPKGISRNCHSREVIELLLQKMQSKFVIFDYIVVVGASFVVLHISSSQNLPVLRLQDSLHLFLILCILLDEPPLEEPHLRVEKGPVCLLRPIAHSFPQFLALPEYIFGGGEDVLDGSEAIRGEVSVDCALIGFWIIVALEVEDPIGVEMRMDGHVECVGLLADSIVAAVAVEVVVVAGVAGPDSHEDDCQDNDAFGYGHCGFKDIQRNARDGEYSNHAL